MPLTSIAFIPDGNRRYARKAGIEFAEAYKLGTEKAWSIVKWLKDYPSVVAGTFYTLSYANLTRGKAEREVLYNLFDNELDKVFSNPLFEEDQIRLRFIGRTNLLPDSIQKKLAKAEKFTEDFKAKTINLAIGYDGQIEILDAVKKLIEKNNGNKIGEKDLTPEGFRKYLYSDVPDPDLIIRTSGTKRLSGFLTFQSVYSELYFLDKYWPEFDRQDLDNAISEYNNRQRRFGE